MVPTEQDFKFKNICASGEMVGKQISSKQDPKKVGYHIYITQID